MIEVSNIRLPLDAGLPDGEKLVRSAVANVLGVKVGAIADLKLLKRSVDARKKNDVGFVATYAVGLADVQLEKRALEGVGATVIGPPCPELAVIVIDTSFSFSRVTWRDASEKFFC